MRFAVLFLLAARLLVAGAPLTIPFLKAAPKVDGRLDAGLEHLPAHRLEGPQSEVEARLAYGQDFLYVHVRSPQASLHCRDRAYQNGDGLILVVAVPAADGSPSSRFQVLGFSPQSAGGRTWQHAFTWYRDLDLVMAPLERSSFAAEHAQGVLELEAVVPWADLAPVHPWLHGALGLNLCYTRAEEGTPDKRWYVLVPDARLTSERSPRRYRSAQFEAPPSGAGGWVAGPVAGCLAVGEPLGMRLAGTSGPFVAQVTVRDGEGSILARRAFTVTPGPIPGPVDLGLRAPVPGGATVTVEGPGGRWSWGQTVLPAGGVEGLRKELAMRLPGLPPGTAATLAFRLQDAEAQLASRRVEDPASGARRSLEALSGDLHALALGKDPVREATGVQRRAYRSALDGTLQPYSLRVPEGVQPGRRYPLLVFLHGSGQDDRGILARPRAPGGWFELAPKGRGVSNCYSAEDAQTDLREVLDAVLAEYPIDPSRIVLAGFSMGGYGVYRTAWERPECFRGLAVFSGSPDLGPRWLGPGHPDFRDPATHGAFRGRSLFVFHGTADRNCPFETTQALIQAFQRSGAQVTFVSEAGKGHESPSEATAGRFRAWLTDLIR